MKSEAKSDIDKEDLICPITLQMFHDPVVAGDGHTYERAAIVQWITEHGTSPITRQPLNINELQSDDYLRKVAALRRTSSVSYSYDTNISYPAFQRQTSTISYNYNINLDQSGIMQLPTIHNNIITSIDNAPIFYAPLSSGVWHCKCLMITVLTVILVAIAITCININLTKFSAENSASSGKFLLSVLFIIICAP